MEDWPLQLRMSSRPRQGYEQWEDQTSSNELRGSSRLTQTPSSFSFYFFPTSPDFRVLFSCKQPYCTTHKILRVRICATHKKTLRCSRLFCCRREVSILLSRYYHNATILYIYTPYTVYFRSIQRGVYYVWFLLPWNWLMDSLLADPDNWDQLIFHRIINQGIYDEKGRDSRCYWSSPSLLISTCTLYFSFSPHNNYQVKNDVDESFWSWKILQSTTLKISFPSPAPLTRVALDSRVHAM